MNQKLRLFNRFDRVLRFRSNIAILVLFIVVVLPISTSLIWSAVTTNWNSVTKPPSVSEIVIALILVHLLGSLVIFAIGHLIQMGMEKQGFQPDRPLNENELRLLSFLLSEDELARLRLNRVLTLSDISIFFRKQEEYLRRQLCAERISKQNNILTKRPAGEYSE